MRRSAWVAIAVCCLVASAIGVAAAPYKVLLVDGTKTLEATLRVGGLAGAMRQSGLAEVSVLFTDVVSPYDDPLAGRETPAAPYDLVLIIPRGVGDGSADVVWVLVGNAIAASPELASSFSLLSSGIGMAFSGAVRALSPLDDLWALFTSALYVSEGWLR